MRLILAISLALLAACSQAPAPRAPDHAVAYAALATRQWQAPGFSVDAVQQLTITADGQHVTMQTRIRVSDKGAALVAVDALGRRALEVQWGVNGLHVEKAGWVPDAVRPEEVLADFLLVYWPAGVLRSYLASQNTEVQDQLRQRRISATGQAPVTVTYTPAKQQAWSGTSLFQDPNRKLEMVIQSTVGS